MVSMSLSLRARGRAVVFDANSGICIPYWSKVRIAMAGWWLSFLLGFVSLQYFPGDEIFSSQNKFPQVSVTKWDPNTCLSPTLQWIFSFFYRHKAGNLMRAKKLLLFSIDFVGNNEGKFASSCPYVKRTFCKGIIQIRVIENTYFFSYHSVVLPWTQLFEGRLALNAVSYTHLTLPTKRIV